MSNRKLPLRHQVDTLRHNLAMMDKVLKDATNVQGALHVPRRLHDKDEVDLFKPLGTRGTIVHKYSPDQPRDENGQWTSGGGGGAGTAATGAMTAAASPESRPWSRAAQIALVGGGLLAASPVLSLGGAALARRIYAARLANQRAANTAWRQARRAATTRAAREAAAAREARNFLTRGVATTRRGVRRATQAAQQAALRGDVKATAATRRAAAATVGKLPPKAQAGIKNVTQHGVPTPGDPAGKLLEWPSWLTW